MMVAPLTFRRLILSIIAVTMLVPTGDGALAQTVGEVVWADPSVLVRRQGEPPTKAPHSIQVGDAFSTGSPGMARLLFYGDVGATGKERLGLVLHQVNLGDNSEAAIATYDRTGPTGPRFRLVLNDGIAYALFANEDNAEYEIATPTAVAIATGTAFVVSCDATSTDVITLSGTVVVRSLVMREQDRVTVGAGQMTSVAQGATSLRVFPAPLERVRQATEGVELIGAGRGESLTQADGVLAGREVLPAEQSNLLLRQYRDVLDPCPAPSAATCLSDEPLDGLGILQIDY